MKRFFGIMMLILAGVFSMGNVSSAAQSEMIAENTCKKQAEEGHISEVDVLEVLEIGKPYAIIINNGYTDNAETIQHETGHCYGLKHIKNDNKCVMTAVGMGHIGQICSTHNSQWKSKKSKY